MAVRQSWVVAVVAVVGTTLAALVGSPAGAPAQASEPATEVPTILVIGDSITGRHFRQPETHGKGWHDYLAEATGASVMVSAEGGSGFVRRGLKCQGTTFRERLDQVQIHAPDFVVVAGGSNDAYYCGPEGELTYTPTRRLRRSVTIYLRRLVAITDQQGMPRDHIYVFMPWGPERAKERPRIRDLVRAHVERAGANFVPVLLLPPEASYDGVHPTPTGSQFLYDQFARRSDFLSRFPPPPEAVPPPL